MERVSDVLAHNELRSFLPVFLGSIADDGDDRSIAWSESDGSIDGSSDGRPPECPSASPTRRNARSYNELSSLCIEREKTQTTTTTPEMRKALAVHS